MMKTHKKRLFFKGPWESQACFLLDSGQTHYIKHVLRLTHGTPIEIFDGQGQWLEAELDLSHRKQVVANPIGTIQTSQFNGPKITLAQGICKPAAMDTIMEKATELGAYQILPILCEYTSFASQKVIRKRAHHWENTLINAGMQCRTYHLPRCLPIQTFAQWADHQHTDSPPTYWFHLDTDALKFQPEPTPEATLVIGPEGGFSEQEVKLLRQIAPQCYTLGQHILRAETAAIASLSICSNALS